MKRIQTSIVEQTINTPSDNQNSIIAMQNDIQCLFQADITVVIIIHEKHTDTNTIHSIHATFVFFVIKEQNISSVTIFHKRTLTPFQELGALLVLAFANITTEVTYCLRVLNLEHVHSTFPQYSCYDIYSLKKK